MQTAILAAAVIILSLLLCVAVGIVIAKEHSLKKTAAELSALKNEDTHALLRLSDGGRAQNELIKEINELLVQMRNERVDYIRKKHDLDMMITNISHDLRTPLTSAKGYAQLLDGNMSSKEIQDNIRIIQNRLNRLNELIDSFFEFSKIISGGKPIELEQVNPVNLLEQSAAHYYDDFVAQQREIRIDCGARPEKIKSNPQMLVRIFDNLIANAYKHGTGTLQITVTQDGGVTEITLANPMDSKITDTERLFDEFYTSDISRTTGSTGLGLAIAKQFTQMLGGKITAQAENNEFVIKCRFRG